MHLLHPLLPALGLALAWSPVAGAQLRANRPPPRTQNLPRLMVATPYPGNTADSTAAVRIGEGMRKRVEDVAGKWFNTIAREQMNDALLQYAYPPDAVLAPSAARQLANQLQARFLVSSVLSRSEGGRYQVQVRAVGLNDKAGYTTTLVQPPGQSLEDFGKAAAETLAGSFKALDDARKCWSDQSAKPRDAVQAALKALRDQPNHGLAEYCLGEIAAAQGQSHDTLIAHYEAATRGDPQSLEVWSRLAGEYVRVNDSAATVRVFQEMLRVAPTNQVLREQAFKLFLQYGKPEAARQVAEEGLEIDPSNADLWDLKSNACAFLEDFPCAVDALEQVFEVDPAKADSAFYIKISTAAGVRPDTARLLKWSRRGVAKYPNNAVLLAQLADAYSYAGPVDSAMAAVRRLMAVDSSDLRPVLRTIQALVAEKRVKDGFPLGEYIERLGDENDKQNYSQLLSQAALTLLQPESRDLPAAAELGRKAVGLAVPGGRIAVFANYILGIATVFQLQPRDPLIMEQKSCELARESQALRDEAQAALLAGKSQNPDQVTGYLQIVGGVHARIESQVKAFCK